MSRRASLMARVARHTRFSGLKASRPSSERSLGSVLGKSAIAGMPSLTASSAAATTLSMERRSTPGMEAMGTRLLRPSTTNSGQIRSSTPSWCSATRRRDHASAPRAPQAHAGKRAGKRGRRRLLTRGLDAAGRRFQVWRRRAGFRLASRLPSRTTLAGAGLAACSVSCLIWPHRKLCASGHLSPGRGRLRAAAPSSARESRELGKGQASG